MFTARNNLDRTFDGALGAVFIKGMSRRDQCHDWVIYRDNDALELMCQESSWAIERSLRAHFSGTCHGLPEFSIVAQASWGTLRS